MTPSMVNGPLTHTTPRTISGLSTSSSCSALAAMQALTSFISARQAARYARNASCVAGGQSGSVSNGTSHSYQPAKSFGTVV